MAIPNMFEDAGAPLLPNDDAPPVLGIPNEMEEPKGGMAIPAVEVLAGALLPRDDAPN